MKPVASWVKTLVLVNPDFVVRCTNLPVSLYTCFVYVYPPVSLCSTGVSLMTCSSINCPSAAWIFMAHWSTLQSGWSGTPPVATWCRYLYLLYWQQISLWQIRWYFLYWQQISLWQIKWYFLYGQQISLWQIKLYFFYDKRYRYDKSKGLEHRIWDQKVLI